MKGCNLDLIVLNLFKTLGISRSSLVGLGPNYVVIRGGDVGETDHPEEYFEFFTPLGIFHYTIPRGPYISK